MDKSWETCPEVTPKVAAAAIFLVTAASVGYLLLKAPREYPGADHNWQVPVEVAANASPLILLCACVLVFYIPRLGYALGLVAGMVAVPWFVWTESALRPWNSWLFFNYAGPMDSGVGAHAFVTLKILSVTLIVITVICSALRLLPGHWSLRESPLRRRTWPAVTAGPLVLAVWYARSVTPYSVPIIVDGASPEFQILHVEKRGLRFHETGVSASKEGRVWVWRQDRRLFQFRFETRAALIALAQTSPPCYQRIIDFAGSPKLWKLHTQPAKALWAWDAEGWYVVLKGKRLLAFTSEYRTAPPREITDMFYVLEKLPAFRQHTFIVPDISLGFGFDPLAAMGFGDRPEARARLLQPQ
ncbi:MAG: hypothetical protein ACLQKA_05550 [Bryobacteraceae bacterium]